MTVASLAAMLIAALGRPAAAQMRIPDTFTNLEVLSKDISKDELTSVMRGFAGALGVRCTYCHAVPDGSRDIDFASDAKEAKRDARLMLRMVERINGDTIPQLAGTDGTRRVTCASCHRGLESPPRALADILTDKARSEGVEAAVATYRQMRDESLEAGQYDFRDTTLVDVGRRLHGGGRTPLALGWLRAAGDLAPRSAAVPVALGMLLAEAGDGAGARSAFERALAIDPESRAAKAGLERLEAGGRPQ